MLGLIEEATLPAGVDKLAPPILSRLVFINPEGSMVLEVSNVVGELKSVIFVPPDLISIGQFVETELFR